jgi:hypothetical protein
MKGVIGAGQNLRTHVPMKNSGQPGKGKGQSTNPRGRPSGSVNRMTHEMRPRGSVNKMEQGGKVPS